MERLKTLFAAIVVALAPVYAAVSATLGLIVVDLVTGMMASYKRGEPIVSSKIKITVVKLLVYEISIILAWVVGEYLVGPSIPVLSVVSSVIGITEFKSILENINTLSGGGMLSAILDAISSRSGDK